jgi:hypothetical protein
VRCGCGEFSLNQSHYRSCTERSKLHHSEYSISTRTGILSSNAYSTAVEYCRYDALSGLETPSENPEATPCLDRLAMTMSTTCGGLAYLTPRAGRQRTKKWHSPQNAKHWGLLTVERHEFAGSIVYTRAPVLSHRASTCVFTQILPVRR